MKSIDNITDVFRDYIAAPILIYVKPDEGQFISVSPVNDTLGVPDLSEIKISLFNVTEVVQDGYNFLLDSENLLETSAFNQSYNKS